MSALYHFTCGHGMVGIERDGYLRPIRHPFLPILGPVVWLTDLERFDRPEVVGLTSSNLDCDRTEFRYRVERSDVPTLRWWSFVAPSCDPGVVADLERFGWPTHWWLASGDVPAVRG